MYRLELSDYFVAWLSYMMFSAAFGFIASRNGIPYRLVWICGALFTQLRGWIPGLLFLSALFPKAHWLRFAIALEKFAGAWIGLIVAGMVLSSVPSVLMYVKRKVQDAERMVEMHNDLTRDFKTMSVADNWLISETGKRVQMMLKPKHDAA